MIKTYKKVNISVEYQWFCMKPSEQGSFFRADRNESKEWYATIETYKNINISRISTVLHQTFRTGLIFLNWSK